MSWYRSPERHSVMIPVTGRSIARVPVTGRSQCHDSGHYRVTEPWFQSPEGNSAMIPVTIRSQCYDTSHSVMVTNQFLPLSSTTHMKTLPSGMKQQNKHRINDLVMASFKDTARGHKNTEWCQHLGVPSNRISTNIWKYQSPCHIARQSWKIRQTDTIVLNPVISPKLMVARFTSNLWQSYGLHENQLK